MIFIRMGPRFLFVRTENINKIREYLLTNLNGTVHSFEEVLEYAGENSTLVFLTSPNLTHTRVCDAESIVLVPTSTSIFLMEMINKKIANDISCVQLGPASLVMRVASDGKETLKHLVKEYDGMPLDLVDAIDRGEVDDTVVSLTNRPINSSLKFKDILTPHILIPHPVTNVHHQLRNEGLLYITEGLESKQWYELRINIYDSKGLYIEHFERMSIILSVLEVGMILGESWTKDHALMLFSVMAYQVKLFTLLDPIEIKKYLMALEYNEDGKRLVDLDLYYRNKKISWTQLGGIQSKIHKEKVCIQYRQDLLNKLPLHTKNRLIEIEKRILENK